MLTGIGSRSAGARWNSPGSVATVYTSLDIHTAVEEALAQHRYFGFRVETALPRVLVAIQARLERTPGLRRMREIERLQERLAEVVQAETIPTWLETPNPAFDGLKPLEVIERGEIDRLWNMIFYLESGVAS